MKNRVSAIGLGVAAFLATMLAGGCDSGPAGAGPWMQLPTEQAAGEPNAELFFALSEQQTCLCQNLAYHAFLVWIDGKDESKNFGERIVALEKKNVVSPSWRHDPLAPLTRGRLAAMICRHLKVRGSLALATLGPVERAARRELEFREVMVAGGGECNTISGAEFVNVLKRADELIVQSEQEPEAGPGAGLNIQ